MSSDSALDGRRQVLLATIALQRFALRSDIGSLRSSLAPRNLWKAPALLASAALGGNWLVSREDGLSGALRLLRLARLGGRCWGLAMAGLRLVREAQSRKG